MADNVFKVAVVALGAVLVVGVLTFAGPCVHDDGSVSTCHAAQMGIVASGVVAALAGIASLVLGGRKAAGAVLAVAAAAGVVAALSPGALFPLCMMATMRCHVVMQPFAQFLGVATAALALVGAVRAFRAKG